MRGRERHVESDHRPGQALQRQRSNFLDSYYLLDRDGDPLRDQDLPVLGFGAPARSRRLDPELVRPHVMRHTAITKLVLAGVDLPTIQRISGHKTPAMVLRYTHVHGQHIDEAIRAIGRTLPKLPANETANAITHELHSLPRLQRSAGSRARPKLQAI